jgi:hypothetical protein
MSRIPIIAAPDPTQFKVWPDFASEAEGACVIAAATSLAAVLQVEAGQSRVDVMDDGPRMALQVAIDGALKVDITDYLVRDFRRRLQRVRVQTIGTVAKNIVLVRTCRNCGCCEDRACKGGCSWVEPDLCSKCRLGAVS